MPYLLAFTFVAFLAFYIIGPFLRLLVRQAFSPLNILNGPASPSFFMGNLAQMHDQENNNILATWQNQFGSTFVYRGFIGGCRLITTDPVAIAHILGHAYDYPKPDFIRDGLASMAAGHNGILTVEGEDHRRQRKILAPAFSSVHVKSLAPIFRQSASQLRDIWLTLADKCDSPSASVRVDALTWLSRATLDVIGLAGFGYSFNSLANAANSGTQIDNELAHAFSIIFSAARKFRVIAILQAWFPFLRRFRRNNATMMRARETMHRIGMQLIEDRRREVMADVRNDPVDGVKSRGRDLLSVLIRSNLSSTPSQQMSVTEVLCQISTFIAAGHETTSSALTWCLYALARDRGIQDRLRHELRALTTARSRAGGSSAGEHVFGDRSGVQPQAPMQVLSDEDGDESEEDEALLERIWACEYLDWVVREVLRVHAPVPSTMRVCMRERDEIPVGKDGYVDRRGTRRWSVPVKRWDIVSVPIQAVNNSKELWGEDAGEFRPERWADDPPEAARAIPGLFANTLTFLNGNPLNGNRACIGFKFAMFEIKMFLYILLKDIDFSIDLEMVVEKRVNMRFPQLRATCYIAYMLRRFGSTQLKTPNNLLRNDHADQTSQKSTSATSSPNPTPHQPSSQRASISSDSTNV